MILMTLIDIDIQSEICLEETILWNVISTALDLSSLTKYIEI